MIIVSAFTQQYQGEVKPFIKAATENIGVGDQLDVQLVPCQGSWRKNCGIKPSLILDMLLKHKQPVLWVDIDGRFRHIFSIGGWLAQEYDFGIWFIPNNKMSPSHVPGGCETNDGMASGTMWFNYSRASLAFIRAWVDHESSLEQPSPWEQQDLGDLWYKLLAEKKAPNTYRLPQAYCKVFDVPWCNKAEIHEVVIEHMQASRRLRKKV